jgi:hypothetical protein
MHHIITQQASVEPDVLAESLAERAPLSSDRVGRGVARSRGFEWRLAVDGPDDHQACATRRLPAGRNDDVAPQRVCIVLGDARLQDDVDMNRFHERSDNGYPFHDPRSS